MMRTGNNRWAWVMAIALLPFLAQAQDTAAVNRHEFSVQQAIDYARKNNVNVKNALLEVQIQQQTNREVTGSAYPQISANGSLVYNAKLPVSLVPAEFFGGQPGTFEKLAFGVKWGATGGVTLNQILFDGQVFTGLKARKTLIDFQEKNVEVTEELIKANVYKLYYQLVVSKTQVQLIDSNIALLKEQQRVTKALYENGFREKLDADRVDVQLANLETQKVNTLNQVANGYLGLKVLIGMPVKDSLVLTDNFSDEQVKDGILEAAEFNYSQRKEFQYAELGIRLREFDVERYKMSKIPTLSLNGYYNKNAQRNSFDFFKSGGDWFDISAFTLNLNIPIFTGFATNARIAKAKLVMQQNINQRESLKLDIDNEIQTARNNFTAAVQTLDNQRSNMQLAENVYQQTKKKYENGLDEQLQVSSAQVDLQTAQTNYINALYNAIIARVDFLKATGKL